MIENLITNEVVQHGPKKIWVIGSRSYKNADRCFKWTSNLSNFTDCDILIIDLPTFPTFRELPLLNSIPGLNGKKVVIAYNNLFSEEEHITEMMKLGGTVICIMAPHKIYYMEYEKIDNYSWLPLYPNIKDLTPRNVPVRAIAVRTCSYIFVSWYPSMATSNAS